VYFCIGSSWFEVLPEAGDGECPLRVSKGGADYLEIKDEKVIEKRESRIENEKAGARLQKEVSINIASIG
jgi:hypothetical protein